jgi:hypothetical protein
MNSMIILPDPFPAGEYVTADVTVWSTKKYDRGQFNVYVGHTLIVSLPVTHPRGILSVAHANMLITKSAGYRGSVQQCIRRDRHPDSLPTKEVSVFSSCT